MRVNTPDNFPFDFFQDENTTTIKFHIGPVIKVLKKEKKLSFSKDGKIFNIYENTPKNQGIIIDEIK